MAGGPVTGDCIVHRVHAAASPHHRACPPVEVRLLSLHLHRHVTACIILSGGVRSYEVVRQLLSRRSIAIRKSCGKTAAPDCLPDAHKAQCIPDLEQPLPALNAVMGRPDIPVLLADLARNGADHQEIGIVAAGTLPPDIAGRRLHLVWWACLITLPAQVPRHWCAPSGKPALLTIATWA